VRGKSGSFINQCLWQPGRTAVGRQTDNPGRIQAGLDGRACLRRQCSVCAHGAAPSSPTTHARTRAMRRQHVARQSRCVSREFWRLLWGRVASGPCRYRPQGYTLRPRPEPQPGMAKTHAATQSPHGPTSTFHHGPTHAGSPTAARASWRQKTRSLHFGKARRQWLPHVRVRCRTQPGWRTVLQHDATLERRQCGGPFARPGRASQAGALAVAVPTRCRQLAAAQALPVSPCPRWRQWHAPCVHNGSQHRNQGHAQAQNTKPGPKWPGTQHAGGETPRCHRC